MQSINHSGRFRRGYSLVEILVYIAILAVISVLAINSLLTMTRSFAQTQANRELIQSSVRVLDRLSREIKSMDTISNDSVLGSADGILELDGVDVDDNPRNIRFYTDENDKVFIEENSTELGGLLSTNVTAPQLLFQSVTLAESEAVKVELTLLYENRTVSRQETFYTTIMLRGVPDPS